VTAVALSVRRTAVDRYLLVERLGNGPSNVIDNAVNQAAGVVELVDIRLLEVEASVYSLLNIAGANPERTAH
jgi:hypothetical protein